MLIDIIVQASKEKLNINIPAANTSFEVSSVLTLISEMWEPLSIADSSEETLRSKVLEQALGLNEANAKRFKNLLKGFKDYEWQDIKKLAEDDKANDTDNVWEIASGSFIFVYPFDTEELSATHMLMLLNTHTGKVIRENIRHGIIGRLSGLLDKYCYDLKLEGYENVSDEAKEAFEKAIRGLCGGKYRYVKHFTLNGKDLV